MLLLSEGYGSPVHTQSFLHYLVQGMTCNLPSQQTVTWIFPLASDATIQNGIFSSDICQHEASVHFLPGQAISAIRLETTPPLPPYSLHVQVPSWAPCYLLLAFFAIHDSKYGKPQLYLQEKKGKFYVFHFPIPGSPEVFIFSLLFNQKRKGRMPYALILTDSCCH